MTTPTPAVYIGLDVGKSDHHAVALTTAGERVYDKALPNDETRLRAILDDLAGENDTELAAVRKLLEEATSAIADIRSQVLEEARTEARTTARAG